MPVLGATTAAASGQVKPGVYLPTGWNTNWLVARNASATTRAEVAIFGDSTTYGSCTTTTPYTPIYSWINKLRALSVAAGYPDGGPGVVYMDSNDNHNYDGITYLVSNTGFNLNNLSFTVSPGYYGSTTVGDTVTMQGRGSTVRIFYGKQPNCGSFTYSIDGGTAVTVNANTASTFTGDIITITGLTDAVHTITFVNLGGGSTNWCNVVAAFLRTTGIVYNKYALVGNTTGSWFALANTTIGAFVAQLPLGLTPNVTGSSNTYDWGTAKLGASYPHPALAVSVLGINNMQGLTVTTEGNPTTTEQDAAARAISAMRNELIHFVRLARAAGADPLLVIPHYDIALHTHTFGGDYSAAIWGVGTSTGCAVVDFNQAIRPVSTMVARGLGSPGVHAEVGAYDAEAAFLWQNALSL